MATRLSTNVGGMDVVRNRGHGVVIEAIHWEHYAQRIEDMDMPSLDEGNFLVGCIGVFVSMVLAITGVSFGTSRTSGWVYLLFGALLLGSGVLSVYFWRRYSRAKKALKKTGATLCREMREVAKDQKTRAGLSP